MTSSFPPALADLDSNYSPAIIDRFARLVDRLPLPAWAFYLVLLIVGYLFFTVLRWLTGYQPMGTFSSMAAPAVMWDVSILALHQYLDRYACRALDGFNKVLGASDTELEQLYTRLTVLPARWEAVGAIFWAVLASFLAWMQIGGFREYFSRWEIALTVFGFAIGGLFLAHIVYQLRLVSRIHASAAEIDLFDPEPLYSFSGLTVRTAIGIVLVQYLALLVLPVEIRFSAILIPAASVFALAIVVFAWPLWGMHRRLVEHKQRIEDDINRLLKQSVSELIRNAHSGVVEDPEQVGKTLSALRAGQAAVAELPTWPWQPRIVRGLATALLLPIFLWLLQELLARAAGF